MTNSDKVRGWVSQGLNKDYTHVLIVSENTGLLYPIYRHSNSELDIQTMFLQNSTDLKEVKSVFNYNKPIEIQLEKMRNIEF